MMMNKGLHSGKWTQEESDYVQELIKEFEGGSLNIEESISLRSFLATALRCSPKRISKKFESTKYNGKQLYKRKQSNLSQEQVEARRKKLKEMEFKYQESLKVLALVEASRKPTVTTVRRPEEPRLLPSGNGNGGSLMFPPALQSQRLYGGMRMDNQNSSIMHSQDSRIAKLAASMQLPTPPSSSHLTSARVSSYDRQFLGAKSGGIDGMTQSEILAALSRRRSDVPPALVVSSQSHSSALRAAELLLNESIDSTAAAAAAHSRAALPLACTMIPKNSDHNSLLLAAALKRIQPSELDRFKRSLDQAAGRQFGRDHVGDFSSNPALKRFRFY